MTRLKFCGLSAPDTLEQAAELGASHVGFVVQAPESHRDLDLQTARELIDEAPLGVRTVLVTPTHDDDALSEAVEACQPDVLQVSGDPPIEAVEAVRREHGVETWKSTRLGPDVEATIARLAALQASHEAVVLDAVEDGYGGHGETLDWASAAAVVEALDRFPVVLAGGLTPGNVNEAIARVNPWCVDVSSGIETDQRKDPDRMRAFATALRGQEAGP